MPFSIQLQQARHLHTTQYLKNCPSHQTKQHKKEANKKQEKGKKGELETNTKKNNKKKTKALTKCLLRYCFSELPLLRTSVISETVSHLATTKPNQTKPNQNKTNKKQKHQRKKKKKKDSPNVFCGTASASASSSFAHNVISETLSISAS
jgi:hypothetical protein